MRIRVLCAIGAVCAAAGLPQGAAALTVTLEECTEGADFIRNAARSRDNGIRAEEFLGRLESDLVTIRSVPAALRWFARDEDDEALLRGGANAVFIDPRGADLHHGEFLATCRATVSAEAGRLSRAER